MFFRRMFGRKSEIGDMDDDDDNDDDEGGNDMDDTDENDNNRNWNTYEVQRNRQYSKGNGVRKGNGIGTTDSAAISSCDSASRKQRNSTGSANTSSSLQLTPLWEHILRTRTLPENICPAKMFVEFNERLRDPEWQVRQHALRVFVDVLVVMCSSADAYMEALIPQLVENLGHPAPTVRKGALDCLRVYLSETEMPETIMLQILDIGLNQKITNEPFGGRLTCGVMLSLPALVQSTLHTTKRHFILRATVDMLVEKMGHVTHQEITLKVLSKIRDLIGEGEFIEYMSQNSYREFELLCNVYGVGQGNDEQQAKTSGNSAWHYMPKPVPLSCWRSSDEEQMLDCASNGKVIMETEIKINEDTLTMRILEAKDDECDELTEIEVSPCKLQDNEYQNSMEDEVICGRLPSARSESEICGVINILSDSEVEDNNKGVPKKYTLTTPLTPSRTPKRVTFGGEVIKMRTPDSDAPTSNNSMDKNETIKPESTFAMLIEKGTNELSNGNITQSKTSELSVEIPNDNTKPVMSRPRTAQSPKRNELTESLSNSSDQKALTDISPTVSIPLTIPADDSPQSQFKRRDSTASLSPRSSFKRISISPVDSIISPRTQHKEIEVLHNLQRDPSPLRARSAKSAEESTETANIVTQASEEKGAKSKETPPPPKSWEELGIVDYDTIDDLRSGNWRHRLQGILQLEDSLRSSDNLALVQPCLDSLLRTLLSSERNHEVSEAKHLLLINLISRLPLDNLEDRTVQILTGLCRQGGAGANRVCKSLMQRLLPAVIVIKLTSQEFLHAKSSRFREHALQMVMYALMTHPSTSFDTVTCIGNATFAALNRKRRVRQAALDVLAILGEVTTTRSVIDVVERIAAETQREDFVSLIAAVRARLTRKQLPLVTADGTVQYNLRLNGMIGNENGNGQLGPDIEWITAGIGSVSPSSLRRRVHRTRNCSKQSFCCLEGSSSTSNGAGIIPGAVYVQKDLNNMDGNQRTNGLNGNNQSYKLQHVLGNNFNHTAKKTNVDFLNLKNRRLVAKSCSDSSMEGRSSDSTYTSSSGGNGDGNITAVDESFSGNNCGITGRFTRQTINSRFPSMNSNLAYMRLHKPSVYQPGMGAYAQLQQQQYDISSPYTNMNYGLPYYQRRRLNQTHQQLPSSFQQRQQQQQRKGNNLAQESLKKIETQHKQQNNANPENLDVPDNGKERTSTISTKINPENQKQQGNSDGNSTSRRFVNVEKFMQPSIKSPPANDQRLIPQNQQTTPISVKSATYSQKSTASARSSGTLESRDINIEKENNMQNEGIVNENASSNENSTVNSGRKINSAMEKQNDEIQSDLIEENILNSPKENTDSNLKRSSSIASVQSKTESIKTQLEDTPPAVSRQQSLKSLVIEEDIEGADSFLLVEEIGDQKLGASMPKNKSNGNDDDDYNGDGDSLKASNGYKTPKSDEFEDAIDDEIQSCSFKQNATALGQRSITKDEFKDVLDGEIQASSFKRNISSGQRSPTIDELKILSRRSSLVKSMETLYDRTPKSAKQSSFDSATETSSQSSNQNLKTVNIPTTNLPLKPHHSPLKQKSKTACSLRNHRRVSPVKQSIKMQQAEFNPSTLEGFDKPREALQQTFDQLDSKNWEIIMQGLKSMERLTRYHPKFLDAHMHMVCIQLTRSVRNLRSQVARAACQVASGTFEIKSKALEQECDDLVCALLHRTADTNRFLREDATAALESMCNCLSPVKILNILTTKGALHQHSLVRTTTAKLLNGLVVRLGYEKVYEMSRDNRDKFFVTGANLLLEGSLDTRKYAKSLFRLLSEHPSYNRLLLEVIPTKTYRNVEKTLKSIR